MTDAELSEQLVEVLDEIIAEEGGVEQLRERRRRNIAERVNGGATS
jgi:hypothetical protein